MDLRRWRGVRFVSRAPTESGDFVDIRVTRMTLPHVLWWHSHVQPLIDQDPKRVDRDWNWLLYVPFSTLAGGVLARQPAGYMIGIPVAGRDHLIPCALVQLLGRFPALNVPRGKSVFVWFLSTAPDEALLTIEDHPIAEDHLPKRLGSITLDVAVTHSLNKHRWGRTALYADTEVLPTLPPATTREILDALLTSDGTVGDKDMERSYPSDIPLPSLSLSPPVPTPLLAAGWRELLIRLTRFTG